MLTLTQRRMRDHRYITVQLKCVTLVSEINGSKINNMIHLYNIVAEIILCLLCLERLLTHIMIQSKIDISRSNIIQCCI